MRATVYPGCPKGQISIPPSKSMAHRAIICASLAEGKSEIKNIAYSDDIMTTIEAMRLWGAQITCFPDHLWITGTAGRFPQEEFVVDCHESGSTLRFLIPIFSLSGHPVHFQGRNRLLQRPQSVYEKIFQDQHLFYAQNEQEIVLQGPLASCGYVVKGDISSQFISGLLFSLPLLPGDSRIIVEPPFESASYVALTLQMLERFGVHVIFEDENTLFITGGQHYMATDYTVEGDFSQGAFFATLAAAKGNLQMMGLRHDSMQGDKEILSILQKAGAKIAAIENGYSIKKAALCGTEIDLADCPDLGPILTVLGALAQGETKISHAARLRYKESDRIAAMEIELRKAGIQIESTQDDIVIKGGYQQEAGLVFEAHKDHRIAMSLAVLGACMEQPVVIEGAQAVAKSYPNFFADLQKVGIKVDIEHD